VEYGWIDFDFGFDFDDGWKPAEARRFCTKDDGGPHQPRSLVICRGMGTLVRFSLDGVMRMGGKRWKKVELDDKRRPGPRIGESFCRAFGRWLGVGGVGALIFNQLRPVYRRTVPDNVLQAMNPWPDNDLSRIFRRTISREDEAATEARK
jgi:hypothetical protein